MDRRSLYVPVLRTRKAEYDALRQVTPRVRELVAPLIEVSEKFARERWALPPHAIARAVVIHALGSGGTGELYVDLGTLLKHPEAAKVCKETQNLLLTLHAATQPVFRVADFSRDGVNQMSEIISRNGAVFRVTRAEYHSPELSDFRRFTKALNLDFRDVDLVVDCELVSDATVMKGTAGLLERDYTWRSVTYVGGSFPPDLSALPKNDEYELPRLEWQCFGRELRGPKNVRYGDYTIQHPFQRELTFVPSASIRYTSETYWLVMRGEKPGRPNAPGPEQYIGHAQLLRRRKEFKGRDYSAGDAYIDFIADQDSKTGNATKWVQASVNHHITLSANQMAKLRAA